MDAVDRSDGWAATLEDVTVSDAADADALLAGLNDAVSYTHLTLPTILLV